jgi:hypothetical protein
MTKLSSGWHCAVGVLSSGIQLHNSSFPKMACNSKGCDSLLVDKKCLYKLDNEHRATAIRPNATLSTVGVVDRR